MHRTQDEQDSGRTGADKEEQEDQDWTNINHYFLHLDEQDWTKINRWPTFQQHPTIC